MNRLFPIIVISAFALVFAACGNDDDLDGDKLVVQKSEIDFDANGGKGFIEVSAYHDVEVTSDTDWCIPTISNNIITLDVGVNKELTGRTSLITITKGHEIVKVAVTQGGFIFDMEAIDNLYFSPEGGTNRISIKSVLPLNIEIRNDWLKYEIVDNEIVFEAEPTENNQPRINKITITAGERHVVIPVVQNSYASLLGNWKISYTDIDGILTERDIELTLLQDGQSYIMSGLPYGGACIVSYNQNNGHLVINSGQYLGALGQYAVYLCVSDPIAEQFTISVDAQYEGMADVEKADDVFALSFKDNGTWGRFTAGGLSYAAVSAKITDGEYLGDLERFIGLSMVKQ